MLGAPDFFLLDQACVYVRYAFESVPYLVGSSILRRDYRDVDVRVMLDDERYGRLFPGIIRPARTHALWSLLCSSISLQLQRASGLPVDFQVQRADEANEMYQGQRIALGVFPTAFAEPADGQHAAPPA